MDVDRLAEASQVRRVLPEEDVPEAAAEVGRAGHAVEGRLGARVAAQVVVSSQSQGVALALCLGLMISSLYHTVFPRVSILKEKFWLENQHENQLEIPI